MRTPLPVVIAAVLVCMLAAAIGYQAAQIRRDQLEIALVDRSGNRTRLGFVPLSTFAPRISPNGKQLAFDTEDGNPAVWIADFPSLGSMRRLPGMAQYPLWSGDGERIFFIAFDGGQQSLFWRRADGAGAAELLVKPARAPEYWSRQTESLTFITLTGSDYDIWRYSMRAKKAEPLVQLPLSMQHSSRISPDEHWLAYVSNETGRFEIYVQPLPVTGVKFRITKDGGEHPVWSVDGREIFYDHAGRLYAIPVQTGTTVTGGVPAPLPITGFIQESGRRQFDITADGKQFLMLFPPQ
jgi:Tol biopolymer transport system component